MGRKCKEVKKVRKLTFLHGQVDKVVTDLKPYDGQEMIQFFVGLISNHPDYTFTVNRKKHRVKKKKKETSSGDDGQHLEADDGKEQSTDQTNQPSEPKPKNPLRDELIFGLTEILQKIQKRQLIGVVAADPLTIHLQATLYDLCKEFNIPFLLSKNLNQISETLKLSRMSAYAFSEKVKDSTSLCHPLYQIFVQHLKLPADGDKGDHDDDDDDQNPCLYPKPAIEKPIVKGDLEFVFDMPPEENFYIPREEIDESTSEIATESGKKMDDFININQKINFFPPRLYFRDLQLTLPWIGDETEQKRIPKLGKSLFVVKSSLEKVEYPLDGEIPFSEPATTQLPSSGRVREKRKKFKKIKQKPR